MPRRGQGQQAGDGAERLRCRLGKPIILATAGHLVRTPGCEAAKPRWQQALREAVRDPRELCRVLALPNEIAAVAERAAGQFPLFVPRSYIARMKPGDLADPLLRQVLPLDDELAPAAGFGIDPVGDLAAQAAPGLLHKYQGRALLVATGACAVHCRYCFRRHFPYQDGPRSLAQWKPAIDAVRANPSIHEIILSGGDPLTLVDPWLAELANELAAIPHLRRLRVHTRLPIVVPERVCDELLAWLCGTQLTPVVVVHANHPAELDRSVATALSRLIDAGVPVLNQAVLLRGVNDDLEVLAELCERLVDLRVTPYYLHAFDRVAGAAHFAVPDEIGVRLVEQLRRRLAGYAVPRFVRETVGETHKRVLA